MNGLRAWARHTWTLALSLGTVAALFALFRWHGYEPGAGNEFDGRLLAAMGVVYTGWAVVLLVWNEEWPLKAHGQWLTYVGDALLWGGVGFTRMGWIHHTLGPVYLTTVRSLFTVAVAIFGLALLLFLFRKIVARPGLQPPWDGEERRRENDRRHGWGKK